MKTYQTRMQVNATAQSGRTGPDIIANVTFQAHCFTEASTIAKGVETILAEHFGRPVEMRSLEVTVDEPPYSRPAFREIP